MIKGDFALNTCVYPILFLSRRTMEGELGQHGIADGELVLCQYIALKQATSMQNAFSDFTGFIFVPDHLLSNKVKN